MPHRSLIRVAVALCSASAIAAFAVAEISDGRAWALGLGLVPVAVYVGVSQRASTLRIAVLSIILAGYTVFWADGTLVYDTTSTGAIVFVVLPFWGVVALTLGLVIPAAERLRTLFRTVTRGGSFTQHDGDRGEKR